MNMLTSISISQKDNILIVAPHPDDEVIGAGGILCCYPEQCSVLVLTDGRGGHTAGDDYECIAKRNNEFLNEMQFLGIKNFKNLGIHDGMLMNHIECLNDVDLSGFSKIFVTGETDGHEDHAAAYYCVKNAVKTQKADADVYLYEVHQELPVPTHYLDITSCIDKKVSAVRFHQSQLEAMPYDRYVRINAECRALQQRQVSCYWEDYQLLSKSAINEEKNVGTENKDLQKFRMFYKVLTNWMIKDEKDFSIFLKKQYKIKNCAIYGYAELGKILRRRLEKSDISILYVLDKKVDADPDGQIPFYYPISGLDKPDAVIVTAVYYFDEIRKELLELGYNNVYSLYDIVMSL